MWASTSRTRHSGVAGAIASSASRGVAQISSVVRARTN
jgi:hypothetical protein